ncbi:MAG: LysR family transcriptional regulator [Dehalococcoidia bacterium]|nr:LysR family transcriptional regulator [Dehalococcoidia bacterium]
MKPDQLRYFLEAARHQHIGKAARAIPISAIAVSHSIAALEEELGRELFLKRGKRIFLTSHGKLLMERAERLLRDIEAVREDLASDDVDLRGHYKLAATHVLCAEVLAPAWARLQRGNPRLTAELYTLRSAQVASDVATGAIDFGLCLSPQPHPAFESKVIHEGVMEIVVRKNHPILKVRPAARVRALSAYPAALPKAFQGIDNCESHPMFAKFGLNPRATLLFDSYDVAAAQVAGSEAWSLMPDWIARACRPSLARFVSKGWRAPSVVTAIWPKSRLRSRLLGRLIAGVEARFSLKSR